MHTAGREAFPARSRRPARWVTLLIFVPIQLTAQLGPPSRAALTVRNAGLNGAGAALVGDAGAVFSNPAALATISHFAVEAGYRRAPADGYVINGALAGRIRQFDLGGGIQYVDSGLGPSSQATRYEVLGVGSAVYRFGLMALGASAKLARRSTLTAGEQRGASADVGVAIAVFDIMALAFSVQNVRGNWDDTGGLPMPRLSRFGFTMNYVDPQETFRLLSTLEVQWPEGSGSRLVLGAEGGIVVTGVGVIGRVAYGSRPTGVGAAMTYGGSLALSRGTIDYAYVSPLIPGDSRHRIGMRLTF